MYLVKIYFIFGIAMFLVFLWDHKIFPTTAKHVTKKSDVDPTSFTHVALESRNLAVMTFYVIFLWPLVVFWEITGAKNK